MVGFVRDPRYYENYYLNQMEGGLPVFHGARHQRGFGVGRRIQRGSGFFRGIVSGIFPSAFPILKEGAKTVGKQLISSGAKVINDVMDGRNIKNAAQEHFRNAGESLLTTGVRKVHSTLEGRKRPIKRKKATKPARSKKVRKRKDIKGRHFFIAPCLSFINIPKNVQNLS